MYHQTIAGDVRPTHPAHHGLIARARPRAAIASPLTPAEIRRIVAEMLG